MSETGWIYFGLAVGRPELDKLLHQVFSQGAFWLGTSPGWADLGRAQDVAAVVALPNDWPACRAFARKAEVRWERAPVIPGNTPAETYRVWLLTEDAALPQPDWGGSQLGDGWTVVAVAPAIRLWGQYKDAFDAWIEVRVPRRLNYPMASGRRWEGEFVTVSHLEYRAPNSAVQFTRLMEVL